MNETRLPASQRFLLITAIVTSYLLITLAATYPLCLHMSDHIYGGLADPLAFVWNFSWAHHAFSTDPLSLYHSNRLYPLAYSFATTYQPVPLQLLFSPLYLISGNQVWATNATFMATFVLCGVSMFLLLYHWTRNVPVSFVAGCMFAFSPVRLPSEQLTLLGHFWTPLAVLCLDMYYDRGKCMYMAAAALFAALQILTAIETGYFLLFSLALYVLFIGQWRLWKQKRFLAHVAASAVLFIGCVYPFMYPYRVLQAQYGFKRSLGETIQFSADPVSSYVRAKPENRILGGLKLADEYNPFPGEERIFQFVLKTAGDIVGEDVIASKLGIDKLPGAKLTDKMTYKKFFENWNRDGLEKPLFQGFFTMLMAFLGYRFLRRSAEDRQRRIGLIFGWISLFGFVMSLGPVLILYGHLTYIPMPYLVFYYLFPGFSALRGVYRFMFMVSFGLSVLGGFGLYSLGKNGGKTALGGIRKSRKGIIITGMAVLVIVAESWTVPAPAARIAVGREIPGVYRWLSKSEIQGGIIEIPTIKIGAPLHGLDVSERERQKKYNDREIKYLYYSTYHFKNMVNGVGSFLPPERRQILENLYRLPDSSSVNFFRGLQIYTFILHRSKLEPEDLEIWTPENIAAMGMKEMFRDSLSTVLRIPRAE